MMRARTLGVIAALCLAPASFGDVVFHFSVNTATIAGTAGSIDLQFNTGPVSSQAASLQILGFSSDGALAGSPRRRRQRDPLEAELDEVGEQHARSAPTQDPSALSRGRPAATSSG